MVELNKIYHQDCIEGLKMVSDKSIDMILCDLPYGTTNCKWDTVIDLASLWAEYERIIKDTGAIVLFAQTPFDKLLGSSNLKLLRYEWIWEKPAATGHLNAKKMPMKAHENILVFYKKLPVYNPQKTKGHKPVNSFTKRVEIQNKSEIYNRQSSEVSGGGSTERYPRSVLQFSSDKQRSNLHPTQKPVALCEYLIKTYTNEGDIVLDNCMGSGTTAEASIRLNRNFIGFETEAHYVEVANERLKSVIRGSSLKEVV
ncbi:DNA-methyltransferase [Bacillus paralicheniformis]|uniref:DNA-methyltransferase n=1 Tax=Bacillus paralicheniformis TaxID=1648923 RepID=UPI00189D1EA4|nr:site-specific DNA-methyltransferase [Bacillus paralicheniformis]